MLALLRLNSERVSSFEDNSVFSMTQFILSGVGLKPAPGNPYMSSNRCSLYLLKPLAVQMTSFSMTLILKFAAKLALASGG